MDDRPLSLVRCKSIKFIWPFIYLDNSRPDMYVPVLAPQTVSEFKPKIIVNKGPFPWNTDQNTKTPLANNIFLANSDNSLEVTSGPFTNTNSADNSVLDEFSEGIA